MISVPIDPEGVAVPLSPFASQMAPEGVDLPSLPSIHPVSDISVPPPIPSDESVPPYIDQDTNVSPPYLLHPPGCNWKDGPAWD
jgi:hypothetical protein